VCACMCVVSFHQYNNVVRTQAHALHLQIRVCACVCVFICVGGWVGWWMFGWVGGTGIHLCGMTQTYV